VARPTRRIRPTFSRRRPADHDAGSETADECERRTNRTADIGNQAITRCTEVSQMDICAQRYPANDAPLPIKIRWRPW
jgi:hypothetical protein